MSTSGGSSSETESCGWLATYVPLPPQDIPQADSIEYLACEEEEDNGMNMDSEGSDSGRRGGVALLTAFLLNFNLGSAHPHTFCSKRCIHGNQPWEICRQYGRCCAPLR